MFTRLINAFRHARKLKTWMLKCGPTSSSVLTLRFTLAFTIWTRAGSTKKFYVAGWGFFLAPWLAWLPQQTGCRRQFYLDSRSDLIYGLRCAVYLMGWTGGYVLLALLRPIFGEFGRVYCTRLYWWWYYSILRIAVTVVCAIIVSFTYVAGQMRRRWRCFSDFLEVSIEMGVVIGMIIIIVSPLFWEYEEHYLDPGSTILCAHLHGARYFYINGIDQYISPALVLVLPAIMMDQACTRIAARSTIPIWDLQLIQMNQRVDWCICHYICLDGRYCGPSSRYCAIFTVPKLKDAQKSAGYALMFIAILYTTAPPLQLLQGPILSTPLAIRHILKCLEWFKKWSKPNWSNLKIKRRWHHPVCKRQRSQRIDGWQRHHGVGQPWNYNSPNWVIALVACGGLAAALSTAAGLLLVISTSISHDLIKNNLIQYFWKGELCMQDWQQVVQWL